MKENNEFNRNLKRYRRWLHNNAIAKVIRGFLPTFLDDQSQKFDVVVNDSMEPCTDGKTIYVSLIPDLLSDQYDEKDWMVAMRAAAAHEAQHVNSSNFNDISEIRDWYGKYLAENYAIDPSIGTSIAKKALNIVEDGRIERIAINRRPGMYVPFAFLNKIIREGTRIKMKADNPKDEFDDFWNTVLSYSKTGLYSPGIQVYDKTSLERVFLGVQSLIDDAIDSKTSGDCRANVQELLEDVAPYICDLIKASPELENSLKAQQSTDEYTSNSGESDSYQSGSGSGNPLRAPSPTKSQPSPKQGNEGKDGASSGEGQNSQQTSDGKANNSSGSAPDSKEQSQDSPQAGFCDAESETPPLKEEDLESIKNLMEKELDSANQSEIASQKNSSNVLDNKSIEDIRAQYTGRTDPINQREVQINRTAELPPELKAQALVLRRDISRIQDARNRSYKGLRRGTLDTGALWKTGFGDDRIFARKSLPDKGSVVFYLLIDNSGSMDSNVFTSKGVNLRKYEAARTAAAVVEEALCGIVSCKIALFNQNTGCVNHDVIKDFDDSSKINRSWNSLTSVGTGGCNADSVNIRIATTELVRRPERKKVLLILSDGTPTAYGSMAEGYAEVAEASSNARHKGIIVIPIMFGDSAFLSSYQKRYEEMYEKNIVSCEPQEIVQKLSALFRQVVCR